MYDGLAMDDRGDDGTTEAEHETANSKWKTVDHVVGSKVRSSGRLVCSRTTACLIVSLVLSTLSLWYFFSEDYSLQWMPYREQQVTPPGRLASPDIRPPDFAVARVIARPARPVKGEGSSPAYGRYINYYERKELRTGVESGANSTTDRAGRVWLLGDVHGMLAPLQKLIKKIEFDPAIDTCILVGDLVAKGPHSLEVVRWARRTGCLIVRGNHDDSLIKWREWLVTRYGDRAFTLADKDEPKGAHALPKFLGQWRSEHRRLAQRIDKEDYEWLVHAPVIMHLPEYHTFVVHAGLLPGMYRKDAFDIVEPLGAEGDDGPVLKTQEQQLPPENYSASTFDTEHPLPLEILRQHNASVLATTESLLIVNSDPYIPMNIRSITNGRATRRADHGMHWGKVWEEAQRACLEAVAADEPTRAHHCNVDRIVYGHAAGRGLDLRKWTQGLDSGCVYGKQLTALRLPLPSKSQRELYDLESEAQHHIVQVECRP